jgi:hypothetical protein
MADDSVLLDLTGYPTYRHPVTCACGSDRAWRAYGEGHESESQSNSMDQRPTLPRWSRLLRGIWRALNAPIFVALLAGADCIDDVDILRAGASEAVCGHGLRVPPRSARGCESIHLEHVRQLDAAAG